MFSTGNRLSSDIKQYLVITGNYWAFTLTDGALRMLVVLYFHQLGYSPLNIAILFLFYEFFGVITNLAGGWLGARIGLNKTMNLGLALQAIALVMLTQLDNLTTLYVMAAQALSGIAKDLNKMSAKSAIKLLVPKNAENTLFKWVAILTGSKNALKGLGFFLGGLLLSLIGFQSAMASMALCLLLVWLASLILLKKDLGKAKSKPKFKELFSKSTNINYLSAARLCLFASRDVWFVVALPVYLSRQFGWDHWWVGAFVASWIILYGVIQTLSPKITGTDKTTLKGNSRQISFEQKGLHWALALLAIPSLMALSLTSVEETLWVVLIGLLAYAVVFAVNSSLHSFLIVHYANRDGVSLDVGFYYMANAMGRLFGTVLSGWVFQQYGLTACLVVSSLFIALCLWFTKRLTSHVAASA